MGNGDEIIILLCRALIFLWRIKGLIVIGTFYFNRALISNTLCCMQQVTSIKIPMRPLFFPRKSALKNQMIDYARHWLLLQTQKWICRENFTQIFCCQLYRGGSADRVDSATGSRVQVAVLVFITRGRWRAILKI